jgi:hypothetical protein
MTPLYLFTSATPWFGFTHHGGWHVVFTGIGGLGVSACVLNRRISALERRLRANGAAASG